MPRVLRTVARARIKPLLPLQEKRRRGGRLQGPECPASCDGWGPPRDGIHLPEVSCNGCYPKAPTAAAMVATSAGPTPGWTGSDKTSRAASSARGQRRA
jgi:hypothetical protein